MSIAIDGKLQEQVITILKNISGRKVIEVDQMIGRDVGIYGMDGVLAAEELEEQFGIDLDPLIKTHTHFLPARWFDRLLGRKHGPPNADLTVSELIDYIAAATQRRRRAERDLLMRGARTGELEEHIVAVLKAISGAEAITPDHMIGRDVGLDRWDGLDFVDRLEKIFDVDLQPLIDAHLVVPRRTWRDVLLGRGFPHSDVTVGTLVDYIAGQLQRKAGRRGDPSPWT